MSIFIDRTFLLRVAAKLPKFAQKKPDLYNFRCPICGDSHKNKTKARGYVYAKKGSYFFMCHNCGASMNFYNFLDKVDSELLKEYSLERFKNGTNTKKEIPNIEGTLAIAKAGPIFKKKLPLPSVKSLPEGHYAKVYVQGRQIPESQMDSLYLAEDFKDFVEVQMKIEKDGLKENDPRLVIPFYDEEKNLVAFQGRALGESKLRYITVKLDEDGIKLFGLDKVNKEEDVYVTEGPIDSMFLENAVATADATLTNASKYIDKSKLVLVYDNEPRNKDICRHIEKAIEEHYRVVIWPEMIEEKDINEMIQNGFTSDDIKDIIDTHTFQNLRAKMEFINWKKV
jgi:transcription elongation factor Elf1